jgi:Tol biopolymer transport system component
MFNQAKRATLAVAAAICSLVEEELVKIRFQIFHWLVLGVVLVAAALPAYATFPGKNGRIVFIQGPDVYTMLADGSDVRQLTILTNDNPAFWANWSSDGKRLVFSEFPAPAGFGQLWLMNADGSNQHLLLNDPGYDDEAPSFSPDGSHIVFARCAPFHNEFPCAIYRVHTDGSGLRALTPVHIERGDFDPVYAPDGNTIAFDSFGRDGVLGAIYLMNPDGSDVRRVTPAEVGGVRGNWSPDGQSLLFHSHCCNPQLASLYSARIEERKIRRLTHEQGQVIDANGSWSPQGDAIVFQRVNLTDGTTAIWIINRDGGEAKMIRKVEAPTFRRRIPMRLRRMQRPVAPKRTTEIEDGGALPRWGVAQ